MRRLKFPIRRFDDLPHYISTADVNFFSFLPPFDLKFKKKKGGAMSNIR